MESKYCKSNSAPPNFRELTEMEFARSLFFTYDFLRVEYRQIMPETLEGVAPATTDGRPCMMPLKMFWFHGDEGIGMTADYWPGKVRYFSFAACEHKMEHFANLGNCFNEYRCSKCGYTRQIDSSD